MDILVTFAKLFMKIWVYLRYYKQLLLAFLHFSAGAGAITPLPAPGDRKRNVFSQTYWEGKERFNPLHSTK